MGCGASTQPQHVQPHKMTMRQKRTKLIDGRRQSTKLVDMILQNVSIVHEKLSSQQLTFAKECLSTHQLFNSLSKQETIQICQTMVLAKAQNNQYIFQQGEPGNSFFFIYQGQVHVEVDGVYVRTLKAGDSFGQLALLFRTQRTASIKSTTPNTLLLIIKPASFRQKLKKIKTQQLETGKKVIENVQLFQGLLNKQKDLLSQNLKLIKFKKGQIIFRAEDPARAFYIIKEGQILIQIQNKQPITLKSFDCFGENCFQQNSNRAGTAIAQTDCSCYFLYKSDLDEVFGKNSDNIFYYNLKKWALIRSPSFKMDSTSLNLLISKFQLRRASEGQILVQSNPSGLIINLSGKMNNKPAGTLFGQKNFIQRNAPCNPIIKNQAGEYAFLSYTELDNLMKYIEEKKNIGYSKKTIPDKENVEGFDLTKFQFLKQLGQGQFGKVYLIKNKCLGGELYAIKCLSKSQIKKENMENCVIQQKRILSKIVFPYIVGFVKSFHDQKNIYFLMEYLKGKQMFDVIREMPFLNQTIATYFFGCLLLSIQHLHQNNIIYRDIKPENSVVDYNGKAFLIDLGTAKFLKKQTFYKTFTLIGTPHYMAPQIFDGKGYSFQVDIWSLGIILYEFTCGKLPFGQHQNDPYKVMKKVKTDQVQFPSSTTSELKQVLNLLLQKNHKVRSLKADFQTIKKQSYFKNMNWIDLLKQKIKPPYIPKDFKKQKQHEDTLKLSGKPLSDYLYPKKILKWEVREWNQQFTK